MLFDAHYGALHEGGITVFNERPVMGLTVTVRVAAKSGRISSSLMYSHLS